MTTWLEMEKAGKDGSLDQATLEVSREYLRSIDGLSNVQDTGLQAILKPLRERVQNRIRFLEQQQLHQQNTEAEQLRHEQKIALDTEAIAVSKRALEISNEANMISGEANIISSKSNTISQTANAISKEANYFSKVAVWISGLALLCSGLQLVVNWNPKASKSEPRQRLQPPNSEAESQKPPLTAPNTSNLVSTTSTNRMPTNKPTTNIP